MNHLGTLIITVFIRYTTREINVSITDGSLDFQDDRLCQEGSLRRFADPPPETKGPVKMAEGLVLSYEKGKAYQSDLPQE